MYFWLVEIERRKKSFALLGAILTMFTVIPTVAAWTQYPDGGVWAYGYRSGEAYSNYYHGKNIIIPL